MSTTVNDLLIEQSENISSLKRVLVNFKKLAKPNVTLAKTRGRLATAAEIWGACRSLHVKLLQMATPEQKKALSYFEKDEFLAAEDVYNDVADLLHETISRFTPTQIALNDRSLDSSVREPNNHCFQLPRITLPKFAGKLTDWENFRNIFESLVANNDALSNSQKFHYLKTSVTGDASLLINNLKISDANYESAWQLLTNEYDDKQALIYSHLHAFFNFPVMRSENVSDLRKLRDTVSASLAALNNLGRPVEQWDDVLIYIITQKFSAKTRTEWNLKRTKRDELPTYQELSEFLTLRIRGLSDFSDASTDAGSAKHDKPRSSVNSVTVAKCICCSGEHPVARCETFIKKSASQRCAFARQHKICFNCLKPGHFPTKCPSKFRCRQCSRMHHTLLHSAYYGASVSTEASAATTSESASSVSNDSLVPPKVPPVASVQTVPPSLDRPPNVLLATAWVDLHTEEGRCLKVRALLDQGSTFSFISESLSQALRTKRQRANLQIKCFGEKFTGTAKSRLTLRLTPRSKADPSFPLEAYVYQRITSYAASQVQPFETWPHLQGLSFADPDPSSHHQIHLLIGADLYGSLLLRDIRQGPIGTPTAQLTALGWVLSGPTTSRSTASAEASVLNCVSNQDIHLLLQKFWEEEEIPHPLPLTEEEERCEAHFVANHYRNSQGRYTVRLPFKHDLPIEIGDSLSITTSLYYKMESRLRRQPELQAQYNEFLKEYRALGHMTKVEDSEHSEFKPVYISHHPVLRDSSCTTNLRVVFNASCNTSNNSSLNDHLLIGPRLQQDLPAILLRWRQWRLVYTADIAQMFRQILVHPSDTDFQRILWRSSADSPIERYRLLTVTYGLAPAPYLAMRVLRQLSIDEGALYPAAVSILRESFYVDDALFGADDEASLIEARIQLVEILRKGGFQLRKWASNSLSLLQGLSAHQPEVKNHLLVKEDTLKVLGLSWHSQDDSFQFVVTPPKTVNPTKRSILSFTAKLYDPLGWAAPFVVTSKILLQELWLLKYDWDTPLPDELRERWESYSRDLQSLNLVRIPRWTGKHCENLALEIHGFADASNRAYAGVIYIRVIHAPTRFQISLLAAKTKVAPIKTVSIPRLELNAVVLLSRLIKWTLTALALPPIPVYGWTDSTIALAWLRQHPSKWNTYVANRVSEVQTTLASARWNHVPSGDNPADCASRGLSASELVVHPLWWTGPRWLHQPPTSWPTLDISTPFDSTTELQVSTERKKYVTLHVQESAEWELPRKFSRWTKLIRVTAYVYRFVLRTRGKGDSRHDLPAFLSADELRKAEIFWFNYLQRKFFERELRSLKNKRTLPHSSPLRGLNPFLGTDCLIRLGGRLKNSALGYDERHPIILPKHHITNLLIAQAHTVTLHGGVQLVLRTLRQRFWLLSGRNSVKAHLRKCVICARHSARLSTQYMGDLPAARVTPSAPFTHCGVDYAGPLHVTPFVGRGQRARKVYIALFVCLATKAIHLEMVEDYSTPSFLAAFHRFASRRGSPRHLYSDNGTNFRGADSELTRHFASVIGDPDLQSAIANDGVAWHFIPSAAPHFGGLWEAGVKSFKTHLKRAVGSHTLSRAELATLLCKIEACLNSRPIAALSDDPSDVSALTPGHFLIGRPLVAVPEESTLAIDASRRSRWQNVHAMLETVWRAWSQDYLHSIQQRHKWRKHMPDLATGDLVIIKNPLLPPSKWDLARVTQTHPGSDGHVRVVTVRTAQSTLKRPITQVCRLPVDDHLDKSNTLSNEV
ncbi:uncharacterized protein LOC114945928 [Nylanderia fulva]|uniref:uncharacterized protein LOC114945928 n=1 Tax=Nylanderia fulva TaxID=613905 RepID=UPI0010FB080A|nr:uncharacterized protein LOC114945928 [Nylanderia fulva]